MVRANIPQFELSFRAPGAPLTGPLRFTLGQCTKGFVLVASTQIGVCAILLGDDTGELRRELRKTFPDHALEEDEPELGGVAARIVAAIDGGTPEGVIHLDVGGTPFQQRVWKALWGVPFGETRTYAQIAAAIGAAAALRAVAGACAANVLAFAIPCHRVVRRDGRVSGYRWGTDRKRALLEQECA
jgi:AraC family transcriptional regulator of adaptative response/methylated-DNA-[protein]-cysteine methyltransferase